MTKQRLFSFGQVPDNKHSAQQSPHASNDAKPTHHPHEIAVLECLELRLLPQAENNLLSFPVSHILPAISSLTIFGASTE